MKNFQWIMVLCLASALAWSCCEEDLLVNAQLVSIEDQKGACSSNYGLLVEGVIYALDEDELQHEGPCGADLPTDLPVPIEVAYEVLPSNSNCNNLPSVEIKEWDYR